MEGEEAEPSVAPRLYLGNGSQLQNRTIPLPQGTLERLILQRSDGEDDDVGVGVYTAALRGVHQSPPQTTK